MNFQESVSSPFSDRSPDFCIDVASRAENVAAYVSCNATVVFILRHEVSFAP